MILMEVNDKLFMELAKDFLEESESIGKVEKLLKMVLRSYGDYEEADWEMVRKFAEGRIRRAERDERESRRKPLPAMSAPMPSPRSTRHE